MFPETGPSTYACGIVKQKRRDRAALRIETGVTVQI